MSNQTTQTIKQIAFPTVNGTALLDSTKYVWTVNGVSPDPETGSVYISNVDSATVLKSYRNINGTPFNGSANITTQYWGTARNIVISDYLSANTGPETSVNGSRNVVLKLPTTIKANIDGNCTGSSGSCTGNSATATNATNANHAKSADSATTATRATTATLADHATNATSADSAKKATTATKATQDSAGQQINTTYVKGVTASNATITVTKGNGTTSTATINNVANANSLGGYLASKYVRSVIGVTPDSSGNVQVGNVGAITGEIKWFAFNKAPNGYLVCNGANVSRTTYADLFAVIGTTFGRGDGSTTFTLPNLIDKFAQGSATVGIVKSAGLPNITGSGALGTTANFDASKCTGAIYRDGIIKGYHEWGADTNGDTTYFDASRSSSIYGNRTTVQPPAFTLLPCIKY